MGMFGTRPQFKITIADNVYMKRTGINLLLGLESAGLFMRPSKNPTLNPWV